MKLLGFQALSLRDLTPSLIFCNVFLLACRVQKSGTAIVQKYFLYFIKKLCHSIKALTTYYDQRNISFLLIIISFKLIIKFLNIFYYLILLSYNFNESILISSNNKRAFYVTIFLLYLIKICHRPQISFSLYIHSFLKMLI